MKKACSIIESVDRVLKSLWLYFVSVKEVNNVIELFLRRDFSLIKAHEVENEGAYIRYATERATKCNAE